MGGLQNIYWSWVEDNVGCLQPTPTCSTNSTEHIIIKETLNSQLHYTIN